jgi:hypothetical protein
MSSDKSGGFTPEHYASLFSIAHHEFLDFKGGSGFFPILSTDPLSNSRCG